MATKSLVSPRQESPKDHKTKNRKSGIAKQKVRDTRQSFRQKPNETEKSKISESAEKIQDGGEREGDNKGQALEKSDDHPDNNKTEKTNERPAVSIKIIPEYGSKIRKVFWRWAIFNFSNGPW